MLFENRKTVQFISIQGMNITLPPAGQRPDLDSSPPSKKPAKPLEVLVQNVQIHNALLVCCPGQ